jgi:heme-degrading monooxygenase HmoA
MPTFIAMNHFRVDPERGAEFEELWRKRETWLAEVPGFVRFALLRGSEPGDYASHTTWESRAAFEAWTESDAFRKVHAQSPLPNFRFIYNGKRMCLCFIISPCLSNNKSKRILWDSWGNFHHVIDRWDAHDFPF